MSGAIVKTILEKVANSKGFDRCMKSVQFISAGNGKCKAQFTVAEEHLNPGGFLHGGFTSTVIDCVSSYALLTHGNGSPGSSVDLHVTFLKAAFPGETVVVDAKTIRAGKTLAFLAVELTKNDGKVVVARGQHTNFVAMYMCNNSSVALRGVMANDHDIAWGKRDESLILPTNDSISASLDTDQLHAKTTVMISQDFKEDRIWLNGREEDIKNPRLQNCLKEIRKRSQLSGNMNDWKIHICSKNNFPTAAGLASSAAGYACLAAALAKLYRIEGDISVIARSGSGSACRSVMGGFVRWYMGSDKYGTDSLAKQIVPASHWPEMRILVLVVSDEQKKVPSAIGMKRSLETSELLQHRIMHTVLERANKIQAIIEKNFKTFAELTMKDSNEIHAICLDTYPPCVYMNDISNSIVNLIHSYNINTIEQ